MTQGRIPLLPLREKVSREARRMRGPRRQAHGNEAPCGADPSPPTPLRQGERGGDAQ